MSYAVHSPQLKTHVQLSQLMLKPTEPTQGKIDINLKQAEASIQRYEQLLEQLLLLSKTEIKPQHASMESTDVAQTLQHIIVELEQKYPDISKHLNIDWKSLSLINLPHATLAIVLKNLIENAYLHSQSIAPIQVYMDKEDLIVADTGHGLTDAELGLLTQRFWRKSSQNDGYGLGLSLVKLLLEKHGFSIQFSHHSPRGLKVSITSISSLSLVN